MTFNTAEKFQSQIPAIQLLVAMGFQPLSQQEALSLRGGRQRNDGLLNLNVEDFFGCKVPVPPIKDQRRIGEALTTAKHELSLLDAEIEALTQQKRGLMQKLLTGEWPVTMEGAVD